MNIQNEVQSKQRLVFEDHNIVIKAEEEYEPEILYPFIVKTEHQEGAENETQNLQTKTELNIQIQENVLNTFAPGTSKVTNHYTIISEQNDDTYIVPDIIENVRVKIVQPHESEENIEIKEINLQVPTTSEDGFIKTCNYCKFKTQDDIQLKTHLQKAHSASVKEKNQADSTLQDSILKCDLCNIYTTNRKQNLISHIVVNHRGKIPQNEKLEISKINSIQENNIILNKNSKRTRTKAFKHTCEDCFEKFTSIIEKKVHIQLQHTAGPLKYTCYVCYERFATIATKYAHMQTRHSTSYIKYTCDICHEEFVSGLQKQVHMQTHHKLPRVFTCDYCQKNFSAKTGLTEHVQSNECGISDYEVYDYEMLSGSHRRKTVLIKNKGRFEGFECSRCPYKCVQQRHFRAYLNKMKLLKKREERKEYSCEYCSFSSNSSVSLQSHVSDQHKDEKPYYCKLCDCKYAKISELVKHIKAHFDK